MTMDPLATVGWNMRQPEIEELRAENERLMLADRQWADHVKRLAEENERLRAAAMKLDSYWISDTYSPGKRNVTVRESAFAELRDLLGLKPKTYA